MKRCLLDTNHAGALLRDNQALWARLLSSTDSEFGLPRPSIGELWYMVFRSARVAENARRLETLLRSFVAWEFDAAAAVEFGRVRAELRNAGRPIPQIDAQIAAIARVRDLTLLTSDQHFGHVSGLVTEDWTTGNP